MGRPNALKIAQVKYKDDKDIQLVVQKLANIESEIKSSSTVLKTQMDNYNNRFIPMAQDVDNPDVNFGGMSTGPSQEMLLYFKNCNFGYAMLFELLTEILQMRGEKI